MSSDDHAMTTFTGSCHCGTVAFEADGELTTVEVCNCSLCNKAAYLHWYVPPQRFRLLRGDDALSQYKFGTRSATHRFCRICGISAFRRPRSAPEMFDINVRCLDGVDATSLTVQTFDGKNWERSIGERKRPPH